MRCDQEDKHVISIGTTDARILARVSA
jgi:hypothetical protein